MLDRRNFSAVTSRWLLMKSILCTPLGLYCIAIKLLKLTTQGDLCTVN